jgi:MarR family transcriptional regulator for hemolysin
MGLDRPGEQGGAIPKASQSGTEKNIGTDKKTGMEKTAATAKDAGSPAAPREARRRRNRSASPIRMEPSAPSGPGSGALPTLSEAHAYFMSAFGPAQKTAPDLNVFLTRKIMRFARRWRAIANEHLSAIGHTQARWEALYWLAVSRGGATQRELAECVGIEEPTLVRMLHRLEQEGLVERRASQADRRTKTIVLTRAAEPHLKAMSGVIDQLREDVLTNIPAEDIALCVGVLDRMLERLERP